MPIPSLLVVDDEPNLLFSLQDSLQSDSLKVLTAQTAGEGFELIEQRRPDAMILDVRLPDISGIDAIELVRQIDPRLPIIIGTAHPATDVAIEAMKRGAFEYLVKPYDLPALRALIEQAIEQSRLTHVRTIYGDEPDSGLDVERIVGHSPAMQAVYKSIGRVAKGDVTTLILGESGTGKELVARAIYQHSDRADGPFLAINCAALPESLLESELFGHERGAFTGADRRRIGKFEQADSGTLFLDEVGDMSLATQAKMLRLLQDGSFQRVGANQTIHANVRIIAATNQNLEELVASGQFRQDLYYRLRIFNIDLPPLRERLEDLPELVDHFIKIYNRELDKKIRRVSPEVNPLLHAHLWPGNIRELQATIKFAMVHANSEILTPDCFPSYVGPSGKPRANSHSQNVEGRQEADPESLDVTRLVRALLDSGDTEIYAKINAMVDQVVLREVLRQVGGNQVQASEILGMSRNTLRSKIRSTGLFIERQVLSGSDQDAQKLRAPGPAKS
ncbi:sigma-54 dependent transcriptional regulator [soil metagenome]